MSPETLRSENSNDWTDPELFADVPFSGDDLPTTSPDFACRFYLREIERTDKLPVLREYLKDASSREYQAFESPAEVEQATESYREALSEVLTPEDKAAFKHYTGYEYKYINQVQRGFWDYETLGRKTPEKEAAAKSAADAIDTAISKTPPVGFNFHAYRGTNLDTFRNYKVETMQDLADLEGQFFLESGFTSTSMQQETSFANRDFDDPLRKAANIEIRYFIPAESRDGVALLDDDLTYAPGQQEFLLNRSSLSYISKVQLSEKNDAARLDMILIPENIYEPGR